MVGKGENDRLICLREAVESAVQQFESHRKLATSGAGLSTGFSEMDRIFGGFRPGDLIVLAGRPSMGKTAWALDIAEHLAGAQKRPVLYFSLECQAQSLASRLLCRKAGIPAFQLSQRPATDQEYKRLFLASRELEAWPLLIDDSHAHTMETIWKRIEEWKTEHHIQLVLIDYLQLVGDQGRLFSFEGIQEPGQALKEMALKFGVPIIVLSQLPRALEKRIDKTPQLLDLRRFSGIDASADLVVFLYRESYYSPTGGSQKKPDSASFIVAKNLRGPTKVCHVTFSTELGTFREPSVQGNPTSSFISSDTILP